MSETTNRQVSSAIIYGIEDRPPFISHFCCHYNSTVNYCRSVEP